jgi:hypothetical protein
MKAQKIFILFLFMTGVSLANSQSKKVPGIVVDYIPASTGIYLGSPSICLLPNGDYVAKHDYFGPSSTEHQRAVTTIFTSNNKGKSWTKVSEINGQFWSNLFVHKDILYIMGAWKHHGNLIIRCSPDGGKSWSEPNDSKHGLLREGEYHTAPMPIISHNGRLWRGVEYAKSTYSVWGKRYSAMMFSVPEDADLLDADSWTETNYLPWDSTYLDGKFCAWLEGNAVVTPEGKIVDLLRVDNSETGRDMAAFVNISDDGLTASFDPSTGFIDFVGGAKKFSIRYDEKSKRYWTIANMITDNFKTMRAAAVRNTLVLESSADLKNWTVHKVLLHHPDVKKHGFQYIDWQFDGKDIIFLSRTAYDDEYGGAHNYHDANYLTFHRINKFRKLEKKQLKKNLHECT